MRRWSLATFMVVVLALLLVPMSAYAAKPGNTCPPSFDLGALTLEEALQLPKIQAALADGAYDAEAVRSIFEFIDHNEDGLICWQSFPPNPSDASGLQYNYNVADNNASVPTR